MALQIFISFYSNLVFQHLCADIISVLAMTSGERNDCINYRMQGMHEPIGEWGHEYVR